MKNQTNKYNFKKVLLWSLGVAIASAPLAVAASCGSSSEQAASTTSVDTSQVTKPSISLSGTTSAPVINTNGFNPPANTVLKFKVGTSAWLGQAEFLNYIITNAAKLTAADLAAAKAHLEPVSPSYTITDAHETALTVTITKPAGTTTINTASANLTTITLSGTTNAPVVNLSGLNAPANTVIKFKVGSSAWLTQTDFVAYIMANAASLTQTDLAASKAHLEPASSAYTLTDSREANLVVSITKPVISTPIDTSAANLSVITIGGTTSAPVVNLNSFSAPANTVLRFQIGASAWLDQTALVAYIIANAQTLTTAQLSAVKAHLEPASSAYTLTSSREVTLTGSVTKPAESNVVNTSAINLSTIVLGGNSTTPTLDLSSVTLPTNVVVKFKISSSSWLDKDSFITYIVSNATKITPSDVAGIKAHLEATNSNYTLSSDRESNIQNTFVFLINTDAIDLSNVTLSGTTASPTIDFKGLVIPENTILQFKSGSSSWFDEPSFLSNIIVSGQITTPNYSGFSVRIAPADTAYSVTSYRQTTLKVTMTIPVNTSSVNLAAIKYYVSFGATEAYFGLTSPTVAAPANTKFVYKIANSSWLDQSDLNKFANTNFNSLTENDFRNISTKIVPISEYYSVSSTETTMTFEGFNIIPVDASTLPLASVVLGGTINAPTIDSSAVSLPRGVELKFQVATSGWLNESDFKNFIINNASTLTYADLSSSEVRIESNKFYASITNSVEKIIRSTITIPINTAGSNLSVITLGGTFDAPIINLSGFTAPANTVVRYQLKDSTWRDAAGIATYITTNKDSITDAEIQQTKARLESSSTSYTVADNREAVITVVITRPTTVVDTSTASIIRLTLTGTSTSPAFSWRNPFIIPTNAVLRYKIGSSSWLNDDDFTNYVIATAPTLSNAEFTAWIATAKYRLEPISLSYTLSNDLTSTLEVTMTKA